MSKKKTSAKSVKKIESGEIKTVKRKQHKRNEFIEFEETAYESLNIPKDKLESGEYIKLFLEQNASQEEVRAAIRATVDALLDSIAAELTSLSSAALVPQPGSKDSTAIIRGKLSKDVAVKIITIFRKYPMVIDDLLGSAEEIKVLDTGIGYVVMDNCLKDNYLVGIVQNEDDVDDLAEKLQHVQHVVNTNAMLLSS